MQSNGSTSRLQASATAAAAAAAAAAAHAVSAVTNLGTRRTSDGLRMGASSAKTGGTGTHNDAGGELRFVPWKDIEGNPELQARVK